MTAPGSRTRRRIWVALGVATILLVVLVAAPSIWVRRAADGRTYTVEDVPAHPVAIVFGAGLDPKGAPSPFLRWRLDIARDLYDAGTVQVVLVSGDNRTHDYDEPTAMRDYLVEQGVPEDAVVMDFAGRDTYDTCVRARRVFEVPSAILVTQGYHLPRAVATCNATGLESVGVGDEQARRYGDVWRSGAQRERLANIKAVYDVVSGRDPVLGGVEPGVTEALERARRSD